MPYLSITYHFDLKQNTDTVEPLFIVEWTNTRSESGESKGKVPAICDQGNGQIPMDDAWYGIRTTSQNLFALLLLCKNVTGRAVNQTRSCCLPYYRGRWWFTYSILPHKTTCNSTVTHRSHHKSRDLELTKVKL